MNNERPHKFKIVLNEYWEDILTIHQEITFYEDFLREWDAIFEYAPPDRQNLSIRNKTLFDLIVFEKRRLLANDLYSFINGIIIDGYKLLNQLTLLNSVDFNLNNVDAEDLVWVKFHLPRERNEGQLSVEKNEKPLHWALLEKIFPNISSDYKVTPKDIKDLKNALKELKDGLHPLRNIAAHPYEGKIISKYLKKNPSFDVAKIKQIFQRVVEIFQVVGLLYDGTQLEIHGLHIDHREVIEDLFDLIIFGSIQSAMGFLDLDKSPEELGGQERFKSGPHYYLRRKEFFKSSVFLDECFVADADN